MSEMDTPYADDTPGAQLSLTDFLDVETLQEMQDSFAAVTRLSTTIRDAEGNPLTVETDAAAHDASNQLLDHLLLPTDGNGTADDGTYVAPIIVEGRTLGSLTVQPDRPPPAGSPSRAQLLDLARRLNLGESDTRELLTAAEQACGPNKAAAVQFLYLLANSIARLCFQEYELRRRIDELRTLDELSEMLAGSRDVKQVLDTATRSVAQVMKVKAASIRLLNENTREMTVESVYNLSPRYVDKGPVLIEDSRIDQQALKGQVVYVRDMAADPRVVYRDDARREGLVSLLCAGLVYKKRQIGVIRLYNGQVRQFSPSEVSLLRAISQLLATAIEKARLDAANVETQRVQRQLHLARDVQRRMLPEVMPELPPFDIAARYVPSYELGGDFYDFVDLDGHVGITMGDVVGKGIAAGLLMASVRASLRAYAQDVFDIDEIISRVNVALTRDTLDKEFATVFYGVLDAQAMRMTYCNAGHEPPLVLRRGEVFALDIGGMILGIDEEQKYEKGVLQFEPGDLLVMYTDGLSEAFNFEQQQFGRERVKQAMRDVADANAHDAMNHILWQMRRFVGLNRSFDDTTIVVVKVDPTARRGGVGPGASAST